MKQNVRKTNFIFLSAGIILIVTGACISIFWPALFKTFLFSELTLSATSKSYAEWKRPSVELYFDVYLFNWTNSYKFIYPDFEKPIFTEHGPYRFREIRDKVDIEFNNNSTVSYRLLNNYYFDEESSLGSLDDVITNVNMVALGAAAQSINFEYQKRKVISQVLNGYYEENIFVSKTARELLFEGYEDDMVTMGKMSNVAGFDMSAIPYDKVGWFYLRNATNKLSGYYNVHTSSSKAGTIANYNSLDHIQIYRGECSKLQGSTGEFFPPGRSRDSIQLFAPDMCRSIVFDYEQDIDIHGVIGYRYAAGKRAVDNGKKYAENLCYSEGSEFEVPSGVMNISACRYSSPIFMSYPHFYEADSLFLSEIEGLNPQKDKHQSYITIEPTTGIPLEVVIRFQANFLIQQIEDISLYQLYPTKFVPAMWVEQKFRIDEEMASQLRIALKIPAIGQVIGVIIFALGFAFVIISSIVKCLSSKTQSNEQQEIHLSDVKNGNRRQKETSSPLLDANGKKVVIKKMESVE
ncbi:hypothetical protein PVAND_010753 [Polypedilum vanderplanki]|uniref:Uncharacterized protein n=1 Tax=Polypedilum vanderplanki TaxID=319348 RepID=A0A9J6CHH1_POLVA|nr:hypothetical protein PVAND_010753 [Polypedilum vanderplanki]